MYTGKSEEQLIFTSFIQIYIKILIFCYYNFKFQTSFSKICGTVQALRHILSRPLHCIAMSYCFLATPLNNIPQQRNSVTSRETNKFINFNLLFINFSLQNLCVHAKQNCAEEIINCQIKVLSMKRNMKYICQITIVQSLVSC